MAFWGVVLKPGEEYTHRFDKNRGRLHISKATLEKANCTVTKGDYTVARFVNNSNSYYTDTIVECNVGGKGPILLCTFLLDNQEVNLLDLEFEEKDDVVFSVTGGYCVHLTGYYLGNNRRVAGEDNVIQKKGENGNKDDVLVADVEGPCEVDNKMKKTKSQVKSAIAIQWKMVLLISFIIILVIKFVSEQEPGVARPGRGGYRPDSF